jgi:hypothetical protein
MDRDTTKLIAAFCNFAIAPKKGKLSDIAVTFNVLNDVFLRSVLCSGFVSGLRISIPEFKI